MINQRNSTQRIKILMTADTVGGVWTYALDLIRALQAWPCEIVLATMGGYLSAAQLHAAAELPNLKLYESSYKLEWMDRPWADVAEAGKWLLEIAQQEDPDLIHLNNYVHGLLPWSVPVLMVGHSCVSSWWHAVKGCAPTPNWQTYRQRVAVGLHCADQVVAPTRAMLTMLQRLYGPLTNSSVIHNGRDSRHFQPGATEDSILSVGRIWDEAKNIAALDRVAPELSWPVRIAGQAKHPKGAEQRFTNVQALGQLAPDEVAAAMAKAAIYALPARYEPFGLSALEAALSGCALVLGDIASLHEVWGDAALYVAPEDDAALAQTLQMLIAEPAKRQALAEAAYERAQRYPLSAMGRAYWETYTALLARHRWSMQPSLIEAEPSVLSSIQK